MFKGGLKTVNVYGLHTKNSDKLKVHFKYKNSSREQIEGMVLNYLWRFLLI